MTTARADVRRRALALLARREHGVAELARRLALEGCEETLAQEVVGELATSGLADDHRFAEAFVRSRIGRGQGPVRIARELRDRGVADERVRDALAPYAEEWQERMETARSRRFGSAVPGREERLRQARFLEQRGFPRDLIRAWLDQ